MRSSSATAPWSRGHGAKAQQSTPSSTGPRSRSLRCDGLGARAAARGRHHAARTIDELAPRHPDRPQGEDTPSCGRPRRERGQPRRLIGARRDTVRSPPQAASAADPFGAPDASTVPAAMRAMQLDIGTATARPPAQPSTRHLAAQAAALFVLGARSRPQNAAALEQRPARRRPGRSCGKRSGMHRRQAVRWRLLLRHHPGDRPVADGAGETLKAHERLTPSLRGVSRLRRRDAIGRRRADGRSQSFAAGGSQALADGRQRARDKARRSIWQSGRPCTALLLIVRGSTGSRVEPPAGDCRFRGGAAVSACASAARPERASRGARVETLARRSGSRARYVPAPRAPSSVLLCASGE
jgi:hypothetical protein